jgi:hypothetical protein
MKKLLILVFILAGSYVFGQKSTQHTVSVGPSLRLNGYAIYAFDDNHVESYYSSSQYFSGEVKGGFQYGGGLEIMAGPDYGLEFTYLRLDSKSDMTYNYNNPVDQHTTFDIAQNWIMAGGNRYVKINPKAEPYFGMMLGMNVFNVDDQKGHSDGATKFAWGLKAGANIWASEKVGLKLQATLLSAVQAIGGGVYFGTGGAGAGVSGFSTYYQFSLGGGLVFNLAK